MEAIMRALFFAAAFLLGACDGEKDDTNGSESDADADADADTDTDADADGDCGPPQICQAAGPANASCEQIPFGKGPKLCADWYQDATNCPNPEGTMQAMIECECGCMVGPPAAAPNPLCACMKECFRTICAVPKD
jgi:hypothetical protein